MRYFFVFILLVVHTSVCQKITKKVRRSVTAAADPIYNATCKNIIKCPGEADPMCVKLKYAKSEWPDVGDKTVYVVMFNRCEMQYVNCHKGIKAIEMPMKNCEHGEDKKPSKKRDLGKDLKTQRARSKRSAVIAPKKKAKTQKKSSSLQKKILGNQVRRAVSKMRLSHKRPKRQVRTDDEGAANQLSDGEEPMKRYHNVFKQSKGQQFASIARMKEQDQHVSPKRNPVYKISRGGTNSNKKPMFGKQMLADKSNNMKLQERNGDSQMFRNPMFAQQNTKLKESKAKQPMFGDRMFATNSVKQLKNYERNRQGNEKLNNKGENGQVTGNAMFKKPMFAANANNKLRQKLRKPMFAEPMLAKKKNTQHDENDQGENEQDGEFILKKPIAHRGKLRANNNRASRKPIVKHRVVANTKKLRGSKPIFKNKKLSEKKDLRADNSAPPKESSNKYVENKPMGPPMQQAFMDPNFDGTLQSVKVNKNEEGDEVSDGDGDGEDGDGDGELEGIEGEGQDFEQPLRPNGQPVNLPGDINTGKEKEEGVEGDEENMGDVEGEGQDFDQPLDKYGKQHGKTEIFNPIAQDPDVEEDYEVVEEGTGQDPEDEDEDEQEVATATEAVDEEQYKADCPTVCPARDVMLCARCTHGVYRTFTSVCHMRMFNCKQPDEKLELVSREPCVMSAPYLNDLRVPKGGVSEPHDEDLVLRYFKCKVQRGVKNSSKCEFNGADTQVKLVGGRDEK